MQENQTAQQPQGEEMQERDFIINLTVQMYLKSLDDKTERKEAYYADQERQDLISAFYNATGVKLSGALLQHFLSFTDGVEAGLALMDALTRTKGTTAK